MNGYADNSFNRPDVTSVNEIHLKAELNKDFHIDLLTIFNNVDVDESTIFMQLYGEQGYPIFKIYKGLLHEENMQWISKWCKASPMEGKLEVSDDTMFEKLIVKIRLPDKNGQFQQIFTNDIAYFTLELHPVNAVVYIRFYIKSEAHVTVENFTEIMAYTNKFIQQCSKLNIYTIPLEYLQGGNVNTKKRLMLFSTKDSEDTINFFKSINYINISIQEYWNYIDGSSIPRSEETMNILLQWFLDNIQLNYQLKTLITSPQLVDNHIPLIHVFNESYIAKNSENIVKLIIRFIKHVRMSYTAYKDLIKNSSILNYLTRMYPKIFGTVDAMWKEYMKKTTLNMTNFFADEEQAEMVLKISNLFGVTINIGLNNINVLGILNVEQMYIIENVLENILRKFVKFYNNQPQQQTPEENNSFVKLQNTIDNADIDFDNIDFDNVDLDNIDFEVQSVPEEEVAAAIDEIENPPDEQYAIDEKYFKVYDGYNEVDRNDIQEIKYNFLSYEREIMANELARGIKKKGVQKIQNALTRLQKFDPLIDEEKKYASECQSDKKPIILTKDEYKQLVDQLASSTGKLTPYGEYIKYIVDHARQFVHPYYVYICCMIFDFHQRKILNPYCAYVKMKKQLEAVYYIPFATANDLFITERWYPSGNNYINRYDESKIVEQDGDLYYPDPSDNDRLVKMIRIFPNISRFHCIDFNASKNYVALPYKFVPDIVKRIALPCCFSKTQVIPSTVSNYNNSLNPNNELFRDYKFKSYDDYINAANANEVIYDGINRFVQLPPELNILFNNNNKYKGSYMQNEWCRRIVFQGYFVALFDFLILQNNYYAIPNSTRTTVIAHLPIHMLLEFLMNNLTDDMFMTMKNGLIRYEFETKDNLLQYCRENYYLLNEDILWEWISDVFDINIFIISKVNKVVNKKIVTPEYYTFQFPEGYDLAKLYRHPQSIFIYKYINARSDTIYDLIDRVYFNDQKNRVNVETFQPFIDSKSAFVQMIIQTLQDTNNQIFFDPSAESYTPTAKDFMDYTDLQIIGQTRTHNLVYTDNVVFKLPNGNIAIMPVYPTTLLPNSIPIAKVASFPQYTRATIISIISIINEHCTDNKQWYYPRAVITDPHKNSTLGFIFDKNIHMYYKPVYYKNKITPETLGDPTLQLVQQFFRPNNSIVAIENRTTADNNRNSYVTQKNIIKSIIFSIEYILSSRISNDWRNALKKLFAKDINTNWEHIGNILYQFVEGYVNYFTVVDPNKRYIINTTRVNISNIITNRDDNLITSYKGSQIQNCYSAKNETDCNGIPICKWHKNRCKVCLNDEELKKNVINYIVNELMSVFNPARYKIMYGSSFSTEPKVIQNYHPEIQYVVNSSNAMSAINTLENLIRGDEISSLAENMKIIYTLTHNFNDIQKHQVTTILRSLTNQINPEVLYKISFENVDCMNDIFMVHTSDESVANDFWFTTMIQLAQRSNIVTIPDFRKALAEILLKNKFIRTKHTGNYIYNGYMIANYYRKMMKSYGITFENDGDYDSLFDKVIDIFRSKTYQPTYIDFEALMLAPWNDYNIAIIKPLSPLYEFSKETYKIKEGEYQVFNYNSQYPVDQYNNMRCSTLPENTSEDSISDMAFYKNRVNYIVYVEITFDNGAVIYKQLVKYDPSIQLQSFEFTPQDIQCLEQHQQQAIDYSRQTPNWQLYGNIPLQVWYIGGSNDNNRQYGESICGKNL